VLSQLHPCCRLYASTPLLLALALAGTAPATEWHTPHGSDRQDVVARTLSVEHATLGPESAWETEVVIINAPMDGPTVMVIGGVHGDEPAGAMAASQIAGWRIDKGRLIVIPRANTRALNAGKRRTPGLDKSLSDFNRQFPINKEPRTDHANAMWALVESIKPDLLIDLHEGFDVHRLNDKSVGSSVITDNTPNGRLLGQKLLDAINKTIVDETKHFVLLGPPVAGSLARAAHERLGIRTMILETTTKNQTGAYRTRQHRIMVRRLLDELDMLAHGADVMIGTDGDDGDIAVAMYVSAGVSGSGPDRLESILNDDAGFDLRRVCATDIRSGVLGQFDVVIFPGGSGSGQARSLKSEGREAVRNFIASGGGYMGICAGAYLASSGYDWSLDIVDALVIDRAHWERGKGEVQLQWNTRGRQALGHDRFDQAIHYANGPLYAPAEDDSIPDYDVWAVYETEINNNNAPEGIMQGTPAVVFGTYGKGKVIAVGPHPEQTGDDDPLVRKFVRHIARPPNDGDQKP